MTAASAQALAGVVAESASMRELVALVLRLADTRSPVLLEGESGTGKDLIAHWLHYAGARREGPFIKVHCPSIPGELLESELFGHEKGAFTDARAAKAGKIEMAAAGTLYFDQIQDLTLPLQAKLLRVIEDRTVRRLGALSPRRLDVRVLAATNRDLEKTAREGGFRQDLLYRLRVLTVDLPPLRERDDDIRLLAEHFLREVRSRHGLGEVRFSPAALAALVAYPWPGNVRELAHAVERAALLGPGPTLEPEHLGLAATSRAVPARVEPDGSVHVDFAQGAIDLERVERSLIEQALAHAGWNRGQAARLLGLTKETLRYRIEKYGLSPKP